MKIAYSILLGEVLDAAELGYEDCKRLQVVCSECQEPVFKVHRDSGDRKASDYFAHYSRKYSVDVDCSARVACHVTEEHRKQNAVSREQRLEYFLSVLPTAMGRNPIFQDDGERIVNSIARQPGYRAFCRVLLDEIYRRCPPTHRTQLFDLAATTAADCDLASTDDLPEAMRYRIARDLFDLLMKPISKPALRRVVDLVMFQFGMMARTTIERGEIRSPDHWAVTFYTVYQLICKVRRRSVGSLVNNLKRERVTVPLRTAGGIVETPSIFDQLCECVMGSIVNSIVVLPFTAILRDKYADASVEREFIPVYEPTSAKGRERLLRVMS